VREKALKTATIVMFLCMLLAAAGMGYSAEQAYPNKPINVLVGFSAGGTMDVSERVLASKAEKYLGQPFVISNNGGGGGTVAIGIVARQKPDGYNLVGCTSTGLVRVPQFRSVPYKLNDIVPIMHFGAPQTGIVVKADSPWKTLKEFIDYAKKNPGKVTYSTTGVGSPMHLSMEYIAKQEGIKWTHVPYPGSTPALTALLGGHVTAQVGATEWVPFVKDGKVRLLATHGEKRMKTFPQVPTLRELGYEFVNETVFMFGAPKGTPPEIIKKLDDAFRKAMDDPEFVDTMAKMEIEIGYRNSADTKTYLEDAYKRIGKMIVDLKIPKESDQKK
jgi:tripartite-type tricarboxylate transporter receptor subunit TctC